MATPCPSSASELEKSLRLVDPILQFLTKRTGETAVSFNTLLKALPPLPSLEQNIRKLAEHKVLHICQDEDNQDVEVVGFPCNDGSSGLHGSTKRGAQRRLARLRSTLKDVKTKPQHSSSSGVISQRPLPDASAFQSLSDKSDDEDPCPAAITVEKAADRKRSANDDPSNDIQDIEEPMSQDESMARDALTKLLGFNCSKEATINGRLPSSVLPRQASYAGSRTAQAAAYAQFSPEAATRSLVPNELWTAMIGVRKLYIHQYKMIEAALQRKHCCVCTGTGSGKSLCFLLPVLTAAYRQEGSTLLLFPTKALAQDQLSKLNSTLRQSSNALLAERIHPATLDGDTPHPSRRAIAENSNLILTNPDVSCRLSYPTQTHDRCTHHSLETLPPSPDSTCCYFAGMEFHLWFITATFAVCCYR